LSLSVWAAETPDGLESAPVYDRSAWLVHSLMTTELVAVGVPRVVHTKHGGNVESARLEVTEVLYGKIHPALHAAENSAEAERNGGQEENGKTRIRCPQNRLLLFQQLGDQIFQFVFAGGADPDAADDSPPDPGSA